MSESASSTSMGWPTRGLLNSHLQMATADHSSYVVRELIKVRREPDREAKRDVPVRMFEIVTDSIQVRAPRARARAPDTPMPTSHPSTEILCPSDVSQSCENCGLSPGQYLSNAGSGLSFELVYQSDGNFVLYSYPGGDRRHLAGLERGSKRMIKSLAHSTTDSSRRAVSEATVLWAAFVNPDKEGCGVLNEDAPPGSWSDSCTATSWNGNTLTLTGICSPLSSETTLNFGFCAQGSDVWNNEGLLMCGSWGDNLPPGSWLGTCSPVSFDGVELVAYCVVSASSHNQLLTQLDTQACSPSGAYNSNGNLLC
eukprot:gene24222-9821_t